MLFVCGSGGEIRIFRGSIGGREGWGGGGGDSLVGLAVFASDPGLITGCREGAVLTNKYAGRLLNLDEQNLLKN